MPAVESVLSEHPFVKELDIDQLNILAEHAHIATFEAHELLFAKGDEATRFFLVSTGRVAVEIAYSNREPIPIQNIKAGEVLGWSWLIAPHYWRFDARALERTQAIIIDGEKIRDICETNHELGYQLLKRFTQIISQRLEFTRLKLMHASGGAGS